MKRFFDMFVLKLGICVNIIGIIFVLIVLNEKSSTSMLIVTYVSCLRNILIFIRWIEDDRFVLKYYIPCVIADFSLEIFIRLFMEIFLVNKDMKEAVGIVIIMGIGMSFAGSYLYQFFKLKSYKHN
ncbi:hypothetical protein [Fusobacterium sp.]|uniref:hypothetical protein n=1 Tax=Fusobacterium sp. TaxID=68766 RepID=UPI002902FFD4|nr:hypothetical protein [Fusobacterium sp.]MDU1910768.1 hypothetical protein [Fusobacterium sp.]